MDLLGLQRDGVLTSATYPDALGRVWSALRCRTSAEVLLSAKPGYEFIDWGGDHHVGGGPTARCTPTTRWAPSLWCGTGPESADAKAQWPLRDIVPMVRGALRRARVRAALRRCSCSPSSRRAGRRRAPSPPSYDRPAGRLARLAPTTAPERRRAAGGAPARARARADLRARLLPQQAEAAVAGVVLRAARAGRGRTKELSETVVDDRSGRVLESWTATRSSGRWRAATRARSGGSPTRCGSGCRCARCSCCRSRGRRCGCCTSTSRCCWRSRSPTRSSARPRSTCRSRSSTRCSPTCWRDAGIAYAGARRRR